MVRAALMPTTNKWRLIMITKITLGIRDFSRFIPQEDVENMAVIWVIKMRLPH